ncbi:MAG TPA: DUF374 domain-containing protein [Fibrobacteria bacterium]|nr:DUF374 domain-containing protein [Fibrobacteria bacterium]
MDSTRLLFPLGRFWLDSLRFGRSEELRDGPAVFACWHRDLVAASAFFRAKPVSALVSSSNDGEALVRLLSGGRLTFIRGSSSNGAISGAKACLHVLGAGRAVATTWDGPKGPAGMPKRGPDWMARRSDSPLVHLRFSYGSHLRLGDWSRMVVPLPFSRIRVDAGPTMVTA